MKELLKNILAEPAELRKSLAFTLGEGAMELAKAAALVAGAKHVFITGIGSSWHAGMAVQSLFERAGFPVHLTDASELLHVVRIPADSAVIALSRSGKSVEIVKLMAKCRAAGAKVIAVTNTPESPLGTSADALLSLHAAFDHQISITMYSALTLVGGLLACAVTKTLAKDLGTVLSSALTSAEQCFDAWRAAIAASGWFTAEAPTYFLARGGSLATAYEIRLLWEEACKAPASSYTSGGFRHGPQEILKKGLRIGLWIDRDILRAEDLALAKDMRTRGAKVMVIGQDLPAGAGDLVLSLPTIPSAWQFLIDAMPAQFASEHLSRLRGVDCDTFIVCPYVISSEGGL
ncbi:MAG: SIS domain-containing protein [Planctomycetes bacterium]|nr:SIS domain-containing protein [Planctomycetota bacterium]